MSMHHTEGIRPDEIRLQKHRFVLDRKLEFKQALVNHYGQILLVVRRAADHDTGRGTLKRGNERVFTHNQSISLDGVPTHESFAPRAKHLPPTTCILSRTSFL